MRDYLLVGSVAVLAVIALRQPVYGMIAFVGLSLLNPHTMTWSFGQRFPFAQVIAIGTIIGFLAWSEPKKLPAAREAFLLVGLWLFFAVTTAFAIYPERAFEKFVLVSKVLLMVCLSLCLINSQERLRWLVRVIALSIGFYGLKGGVFAVLTGGTQMVWGPEHTFFAGNNGVGLVMAMNLPILFFLWKTDEIRWIRWVILPMLIFTPLAVLCTFSRGAWLGLVVALGMIAAKSRYKPLLIPALGILLLVSLPYVSQLASPRITERWNDAVNYGETSSVQSRYWSWEFCKRVGMANPLFGGGFDLYSTDTYAEYYPEFGEVWGHHKVWSCHNTLLSLFAEHGFTGLLLWSALLVSCLATLRAIRKNGRDKSQETSWIIAYADMLQIAFCVFIVTSLFVDFAYFDLYYQLVAVVIIMQEVVRQTDMAPSSGAAVRTAGAERILPNACARTG